MSSDLVVWKMRRLTLKRAARRMWEGWRKSGVVGMAAYLGGFALLCLVSLWQTYRFSVPPLDPWLMGGLGAVWWLSAWLVGRPALGVEAGDELLLRTPAAPWAVLTWPLLRAVAGPLAAGTGLGLLGLAWVPAWWPLALALPTLAAGRPLLQTLAHDARQVGDHRTRNAALALSLWPLLGGLHPALLPTACLLSTTCLLLLWRRFWAQDVHPVPLLHGQVEAVRQGARRLGLPVPEGGADGVPPPRRLSLPPRGRGPFAASLWRGGLHVLRRPWRLLLAPLVGLSVAAGSPLVLAFALEPLLVLLAPPVPAALPLSSRAARVVRTLPGGLALGLLLGLGAGGAAALGLTSPLSIGVALLLPWAALSCLAWLGTAAPGGLSTQSQLRFASGLAPSVGAFLCSAFGAAWLAPLAVLLIGALALIAPGGWT